MAERWSGSRVVEFILSCRWKGGTPVFRATIKGERFQVRGENAVLAVCYGAAGEDSVLFYGVPEEDVQLIMSGSGDWMKLLEKYSKHAGACSMTATPCL